MKKLSAILCLALLLAGCVSNDAPEVKGSGKSAKDKNGDYATAEITMKGDDVVSITLDETKQEKSKKELGDDYQMKSQSKIGKEWYEQVEHLEKYIQKNGLDKVELNEDGKAKNEDVLSGCTISIANMMEAAKDAKANAK